MNRSDYLSISHEVRQGLEQGQGVVALESTIIAHGMPYPQNVETALEVEELVKDQKAVPATIAVMDGKIKVGLSHNEIEVLGKKGSQALKLSRKDLPLACVLGQLGATTVAATMFCASLAGIRVFATGGIGGVHRGAEKTFDVSADLIELSETSVAVVCAGAKSILDLGKTLEVLETLGVPVLGYQTKTFPAFFCPKSDHAVDQTVNNPKEIAQFLSCKWTLGLKGGVVLANPVPKEDGLDNSEINQTIEDALIAANKQRITRKALTPFLLSEICQKTNGESLHANIALVKNNAVLAAQIAKELESFAQ